MNNSNYDYLSWVGDPEIQKFVSKEKILYTAHIIKINHYNMSQERNIMITDTAMYNLKKKSLKRRIVLKNIRGITITTVSSEFVIHGMDIEYDYEFISPQRLLVLEVLSTAVEKATKKPLILCVVDDKNLKGYVTTKKEKNKDAYFSRMNESKKRNIKEYLDEQNEKIKQYNSEVKSRNRAKTNTIYSGHGTISAVCIEDFKIINVIGRGSYGKVCLVEYKPTKEVYAMKSLKKDVLLATNQVESTLLEKKILQSLVHPFLVGMVFCFQTEERVYFVMPFIQGGELFQHLRNFRFFDEQKVKFYASIIGVGLEHMHSKGIIYRDIKPENILMDENGYLKIADFGMAKILGKDEKANSFCGTPEYLAPEIITGEGHNALADWWSFGILIYEMLCGIPPFYCDNTERMYRLITHAEVKFPKKIEVSDNAKDLISKLLVKRQEKRFGCNGGFEEIKKHPFFNGIDFNLLIQKKIPPPFKPALNGVLDIQNFDSEFTSEPTVNSALQESKLELIKRNQDKFEEFN